MACATLVFSSLIGRVAYTGLCSVVLRDGWPRLTCVHGTAGLGWLVFSSIAGRLAQAGFCSVVLRDCWPRLACVQ